MLKKIMHLYYEIKIYKLLMSHKPDFTHFWEIDDLFHHFGNTYPPQAGNAWEQTYKNYLSDWERRDYLEIRYKRKDFIYDADIRLSVKGEDQLSLKARIRKIIPYISFFSFLSAKELISYLNLFFHWLSQLRF